MRWIAIQRNLNYKLCTVLGWFDLLINVLGMQSH